MSSADFWAYIVVGMGATGTMMFAYLTWKARRTVKPTALVLGVLIALVCLYPAILWGAQLGGLFVITPEYGRPALALALSALVWLGILAYGQKP